MPSSKVFAFILLGLISMSHTVISSGLTNITTKHSLVTEFEAEHLSYEWTIRNFTLLPEGTKCFNSSDMRENNQKWKLSFCPKLWDNKGYHALVDLYPHPLYSRDSDNVFEINGEFSILKSNHIIANRTLERELVGQGECTHDYDTHIYGCIENHYNVRLSELLSSSDSNDNITIRWEIDMPLNSITKTIDVLVPPKQEIVEVPQKGQLNEDFGRLLNESTFSDVEIIVGTQKSSVHEIILATRSPVFADLLKHLERNVTGKLQLTMENIEPAVMTAMLEYLYTDDVSNLDEFPLTYELLAAADWFKLPRLKDLCEKVLRKRLGSDNAADILVLTDRYGLSKLKKRVMEFIRNHFPDVMETESYKKLKDKSPALLMEILFSDPGRRF